MEWTASDLGISGDRPGEGSGKAAARAPAILAPAATRLGWTGERHQSMEGTCKVRRRIDMWELGALVIWASMAF
jgi:hypothetical protein